MPKDASGGCMEKWLSYMVFCLRPPSSLTIFITAVKSELFLENMVRVFVCDHLLSCVHLFVTPWTVACQAPLSLGFSRKNTGVGCHFLLQRIFLTQGWKPGLLHCRQFFYSMSHQGGFMCVCVCRLNSWSKLSLKPFPLILLVQFI